MKIEPKYLTDKPPGVFEKRVFIGGNYQRGATIQDIAVLFSSVKKATL